MTKEQAEALPAGAKIKYWDGRIATVAEPSAVPPGGEVNIVFDADPDPKPICGIKSFDFLRAEPI